VVVGIELVVCSVVGVVVGVVVELDSVEVCEDVGDDCCVEVEVWLEADEPEEPLVAT